jgi:hypothetical protein
VSRTAEPQRFNRPTLTRIAFLGVVFGLSSDLIGVPLGRWTYQVPAVAPLIWACLWPVLFVLLPRKVNRFLEYFLVGILGLATELLSIGAGFLTYLVKTSYILYLDSRWAPLAVCGWPFSSVMFFAIALDFYEKMRSGVGSARALLYSTVLMALINVLVTLGYIFSPL